MEIVNESLLFTAQQNQMSQCSTKMPKSTAMLGNKTFKLPGRTRTESLEDDSTNSLIEPGISSTGGSVRSRTSTHSPDLANNNKVSFSVLFFFLTYQPTFVTLSKTFSMKSICNNYVYRYLNR